MHRRLGALAVTTVLLAVTAACGGGDEESGGGDGGPDQVAVGVIPIVDVAPIYLGQEQGFFEEQDIELTLETGQGGAAIVPGVVSGQFQFGFSNMTSLLVAAGEGLPLKVVAAGISTTGEPGNDFSAVVVPEGSPIKDAADLEGASIAVNTLNNIGSTTINEAVREAGGDPTTIEYLELGFPDMPAALAEGRVDAAWVVEPFTTIAQSQGATPVLWNFAELDPDLMVAAYFTSEQVISEQGDLVDRFTEAMNQSLEYANEHPDEVREVLGTYTEIDAETAENLVLPRWPVEIDAESTQLLADLAVEDGAVEGDPDVAALLP